MAYASKRIGSVIYSRGETTEPNPYVLGPESSDCIQAEKAELNLEKSLFKLAARRRSKGAGLGAAVTRPEADAGVCNG